MNGMITLKNNMEFEKVEVNSEKWFDLTPLKNEEFRDVEGFEGYYQISNYGRVKSLKRETKVCLKNNTKRVVKERILKNSLHLKSRGPHYRIRLSKENKTVMIYIHRLIAKAFIPNPNNYPIVNHKDGNELNNMVDNLEWCTIEHNVRHALKTLNIKNISTCCQNKRKTSGGYIWKYKED